MTAGRVGVGADGFGRGRTRTGTGTAESVGGSGRGRGRAGPLAGTAVGSGRGRGRGQPRMGTAEDGDSRCRRPARAAVGEGGPEQGRDAGGSAVMRPLARAGGDGRDGNGDGRDRDGATGTGMATTGSVGESSRRLGDRGRARAGTLGMGAWRSHSQLCSLNFSQVNRVNYVLLITLLVIIEKKRLK